jgi:hypothetical protein
VNCSAYGTRFCTVQSLRSGQIEYRTQSILRYVQLKVRLGHENIVKTVRRVRCVRVRVQG